MSGLGPAINESHNGMYSLFAGKHRPLLFPRPILLILAAAILAAGLLPAGCASPEESGEITPSPTPTVTPAIGVTLATVAPPTAALVQTTPTPLPTPTETPTPTPIVYEIQPGDTLLAIAIQKNTSVDEIVALNPTIQPQLLQIGQLIQLPPPATPIRQTVLGTPIPVEAAVKAVHLYRTPVGGLWVIGEVVNEGAHPVENVQVEAALLDEAGNVVVTVTAWVTPAVILPGARAPFAVLLADAPLESLQPAAMISSAATVNDLGSRYLDLVVAGVEMVTEESHATLTGRVTNVGEDEAVQTMLVATVYDGQGRVAGFKETVLPGSILPGESAPFQLTLAPPGGRPVDYYLSVMALREQE